MIAESFDIRVLNTGGIEDHHAHLLRLDYLDRCLFFSVGNDDRAVDAHCLRLLASQAIVVGAYDQGRLRASVEIIPDRAGRSGSATLIAEQDFQTDGLAEELMACARNEAQKHGLFRLDFVGMTGSPQVLREQVVRFA
jgi:hypothetical protein